MVNATSKQEDRMGLAERRGVENFRNDDYPGWKAKIDQAAGFELPVEVSWDELAAPGYASSYASFFPKVYFEPLVDALTAVTVDELGQNAVRDGLKKIIVRNSGQYASTQGLAFDEGVLTFDHKPDTNVDYGADRAKGIQQVLESGL
jgi:hypothetical protein